VYLDVHQLPDAFYMSISIQVRSLSELGLELLLELIGKLPPILKIIADAMYLYIGITGEKWMGNE